jgi:tetratricopeptide (TPR) repeat protein
VQDAMATEVTSALAVRLGAEEPTSPRSQPTNVAAYDAYLRARHLLRRRTIEDSTRAAELLEEAVRRDPTSGAAYASLGFAYISVPLLGGASKPFVSLGRQAAQRALELDPTLAEPHSVLGRIKVHFDWDIEGGHRQSRRAIELEPDNPFVLHCYSLILADEGQFEEALALADRALALDPASVIANRDKAIILYLARRYEESIQQGRRTLELDPYYVPAYHFLAQAYEQLGLSEQAVEAYITPLTFSEKNQEIVASLRAAAKRGSAKEFWKERVRIMLKAPQPSSVFVAAAYVKIAEHDRAFEWLEKLYAERGAWIRSLKVNPVWDPLRADPRFHDLLRRANMAPQEMQLLSRQHTAR